MQIHAAQQELFPVEYEPLFRREFDGAESETRLDPVEFIVLIVDQAGNAAVKIRSIRRPQFGCGAVPDDIPAGKGCRRAAVRRGDRMFDPAAVDRFGGDPDSSVDPGVDSESVPGEVHFADAAEPDAAVDAGAGVPARSPFDGIVDPHGHEIFSGEEGFGDIGFKTGVSVQVLEDMTSIDEQIGRAVGAVEVEQDTFAVVRFDAEVFAIIHHAVGQIGVLSSVGECGVELT